MSPRRLLAAVAALAAVLTLGSAPASAGTWERDVVLKVLSFNIFYGGDDLDLATGDFCGTPDGCPETLDSVVRTIRASGADVVGLQEAERNTSVIARRLGWYGSDRAHVISRYPIVDPPGSNGLYVFVEPSPGRVVAVTSAHLPSDPYGPYLVRDGGSRSDVLALEREVRLPAVRDHLRVLPGLARRGIPVVMTGDFNSPSHLDWTPAVARSRPDVPFPVAWPVSRALADAGLRDSYREAHPDPVARPGYTWTPGGPERDEAEVFDRIDWVLHAGPSRTLASTVVGERGNPDAGIGVAPFPSDHRGVLSTLRVTPARSPVLVAPADRRVTIGSPLAVTFHAPARRGVRVGIVDGDTLVTSVPTSSRRDGTVRLDTRRLGPGEHRVVLLGPGGRRLSEAPIWAYPPGAPATVATGRATYPSGRPITVRWRNAPGMALDWISVYRCPAASEPCDPASDYLVYVYTGNAVEGRAVIGRDALGGDESWPLPPGSYVVRLLVDDGYRPAAESPRFTVTAPGS